MKEQLNDDAQPSNQAFNWNRRLDRGMDELIGIARGVLADGCLVLEEVRFMRDWLRRNEPLTFDFFGRKLLDAFDQVLADDVMSAEEEDWLVGLLLQFAGGTPQSRPEVSYSTSLPLDEPPPIVTIPDRAFCFTGKFGCGT